MRKEGKAIDIYMNLTYNQYKGVEHQCKQFDQYETTHTSVEGSYHKAFRITLGDVTIEFQGPVIHGPKEA